MLEAFGRICLVGKRLQGVRGESSCAKQNALCERDDVAIGIFLLLLALYDRRANLGIPRLYNYLRSLRTSARTLWVIVFLLLYPITKKYLFLAFNFLFIQLSLISQYQH